ncbi:MAG: glutamate---cysteine ligase / carboxylate-amine ligase [Actinomycetota bacterium]|jgi:carboxylate-amine ligase|nr:glutamate---cysteine ligase / carboxylate-amine ligase [Actinomycetota bacterium]
MSPTVGVEEEFLLVDETGHLSRQGPHVLEEAHDDRGELQHELTRCQIESATGICRTPDEVLGQLRGLRDELATVAARQGLRLVPSGSAVLAEENPPELTPNPRYHKMADHFGANATSVATCGCHVHVAVDDRATGVEVLNHLRPWLPILLALTANSPFNDGVDTRYSSWRHQLWTRWPSAGPPPYFSSLDEYEAVVDGMLRSGAILDRGMIYWHIRLSDNQPTLETRVSDVAATAEEATLLAVVIRGLVTTALEAIADGRPASRQSGELLRSNLWRAARDGLAGQSLHPVTELLTPFPAQLVDLLDHIGPALRAGSGDLEYATEGVAKLLESGGGAERQRAAFARRNSLEDVLAFLALTGVQAGLV